MTRLVFMATPFGRGTFEEQALEAIKSVERVLTEHSPRMQVTAITAFLRDPVEYELKGLLSADFFRNAILSVIYQAPCNGAAIAFEVWAVGGPSVTVESSGPNCTVISYDSLRWVHCGNIIVPDHPEGVYAQTSIAMQRMQDALKGAKSGLDHAVRTWFYLGDITETEFQTQRYMELNRARTDFYNPIRFHSNLLCPEIPRGIYPASTGIGMWDRSLAASCLTLQTERTDLRLIALENPQQTPAYAYHPKYSPQSPKFSRAMALVTGKYITTWISGTASIVDSESKHPNDAASQTEQTVDNIEKLVSPENFAFHGVRRGGAGLQEVAKLRVYVKRLEDFAAIQQVCSRRFGAVPVMYVLADVCRPELLVEIEGVAFSPLRS